ncbi:MAG: formate dehydrogenase [Deltaproteobacteria bacterium DG_8]|nr:MAG: formate dehydrogenase [Deltaproteobacteria bacterium DG_8]
MTNSIDEFQHAECIFIIGSNTTEAHPLIASRIFKAKEKGAKIIVADPRKIHIAHYADIHVRQKLGSDVALINGIMQIIISEGWEAKDYIASRTEQFEQLKEVVSSYTPKKVEEITGVRPEDLRAIAKAYATSKSSSIVYAMGITQHTTGVDNVKSLANLAMLCGRVGVESGGVNPLRGQNNVQGACDMGALPNVYPGYQQVSSEEAAKKFEAAWGVTLSRQPGLTIMDMFNAALEGKMKGMVIMGENPMISDPDLHHVEEALKTLDFLVVIDIFLTETGKLADVVLPGVSFAEKDGTFTNTERRVQRIRKAIEPLGNARADWQILCDIAKRMGYSMEYSHPSEIQDEIANLTPSYGGIFYDRLEEQGLQWPCPTRDHPGTKFLHKDTFTRGNGLFHTIEYKPPAELSDEEYPFQLTTGRTFVHFHTGTMTRTSPSLHAEMTEGYVEINPRDAEQLGVKEDHIVKVTSRRGEIETKVTITSRVGEKVVFIPFHFAEAAANTLTNAALDPIAKIPEYKVCAVRVEKTSIKREANLDNLRPQREVE